MSIEDVKHYLIWWNNSFPFDKWWRDKHNIAFLSKEHKEASLIDIFLEYEEEVFFANLREKLQKKEDPYTPGKGNFLRRRELTQEEIEAQFDAINLDDFDAPEIKRRDGRTD